jgi:sec-independent protein translocase protein TatA
MSLGIWQVLLILLIVLIVFGAGRLPKVMGDLAQGVKSFKQGIKEEEEQGEGTLTRDKNEQGVPGPALDKDEVIRS